MTSELGFRTIREQVLAQAEQEARQIREQADYEAQRILREAERDVERIVEAAESEAAQEQESQSQRTASMARLDERRVELVARQELIDETLTEALQRLQAANPEKKRAIYLELLPERVPKDSYVQAAQGERELLASVVEEAGLASRLRVDETEGSFRGGFIWRSGLVSDDLTFAGLFAVHDEELRELAAQILFRPGAEA